CAKDSNISGNKVTTLTRSMSGLNQAVSTGEFDAFTFRLYRCQPLIDQRLLEQLPGRRSDHQCIDAWMHRDPLDAADELAVEPHLSLHQVGEIILALGEGEFGAIRKHRRSFPRLSLPPVVDAPQSDECRSADSPHCLYLGIHGMLAAHQPQ